MTKPAGKRPAQTRQAQPRNIRELERRLAEAEETLRAIREGEVDAVVVSGSRGEQVFTLSGADAVYRLVVETMKEAACMISLDGTILFSNAQFGELLRRPLEKTVGRAFDEFVAKDYKTAASALRSKLQGGSVRQRLVLKAIDGARVPAYVSASLLPQPDGAGICIVASDLTELESSTELIQQLREHQEKLQSANEEMAAMQEELRVQNEELAKTETWLERRVAEQTVEIHRGYEAVRTERQRFLAVLETLPAIITLLRPDHRVEWVNRAYRDAFGDSIGHLCYASQFGRHQPCGECETFLPLKTGQPHHWEWTLPNGRTFEIYNFPFADTDGSPMILGMDIDITDRRRAERDLEQAHADLASRAAQLRALAGELTLVEQRERRRMAKVLHDHIQQLLVAAKFQTALLGRAGDELVGRAAGELEQLLNNVIDATRSLTAEMSPPILHESGLGAGLEWLGRWMAQKHGLVVELSMEHGVPQLPEDVRILLFESIRELLFNAVKHARVRSAAVSVRRIGDHELQITVSDTGPGFSPASLKAAGEAGVGFGLFSIRERLALIGARLNIDSAPGEGCRITMTCLLDHEHSEVTPPAAPIVSEGWMSPMVPPIPGAKIRVLLADDHRIMREGLNRLLGQEPDIEIAGEAADGEEAVRLAQQLRPDIVLMDLSMPKLSGIDATRAIRNLLPEVQVIGLSMFDEAERAESMHAAGVFAYLSKTGPTQALLNAIRSCRAAWRLGSTGS